LKGKYYEKYLDWSKEMTYDGDKDIMKELCELLDGPDIEKYIQFKRL
jgi:hypothetical protein